MTLDRDLPIGIYQAVHAEDRPRVYNHWHASAIAKCPAEQYLLRQGEPTKREVTGGLKIRWAVGHKVEEAVRPHLLTMFPDLVSNHRLTNENHELTGEFDNYVPSQKRLIEVKSVHPFAFQKGPDAGLRDDQPYLHHEWQQHAYVLLMQEEDMPVESISYLYVSLDGRLCAYTTPVSGIILAQVASRLALLNDAWAFQEAPTCICGDKQHPLYASAMQWCDYQQEGQPCCLGS